MYGDWGVGGHVKISTGNRSGVGDEDTKGRIRGCVLTSDVVLCWSGIGSNTLNRVADVLLWNDGRRSWVWGPGDARIAANLDSKSSSCTRGLLGRLDDAVDPANDVGCLGVRGDGAAHVLKVHTLPHLHLYILSFAGFDTGRFWDGGCPGGLEKRASPCSPNLAFGFGTIH